MNREEVRQILQAHHAELVQKYGVPSPFLFGSVARDEAGPAGDVDRW
jgi:predicted nucleotidyltransferase